MGRTKQLLRMIMIIPIILSLASRALADNGNDELARDLSGLGISRTQLEDISALLFQGISSTQSDVIEHRSYALGVYLATNYVKGNEFHLAEGIRDAIRNPSAWLPASAGSQTQTGTGSIQPMDFVSCMTGCSSQLSQCIVNANTSCFIANPGNMFGYIFCFLSKLGRTA